MNLWRFGGKNRASGNSGRECFEGVLPFSVEEPASAPELAERFDGPCAFDLATHETQTASS